MRYSDIFNPSARIYNKPVVPKLTRDNDFDLLRFLLAACVIFYHTKSLASGLDFPLARISVVPVFLFLSGLLITESFYSSPSLKAYAEKRARRIYPGYITAVIFGGLLAYLGWKFLSEQSVSITNLGKYLGFNALFANWLFPCMVTDVKIPESQCAVNGSLWIMKWEVIYYSLLPLMLIVFSRIPKILCLALIIFLTAYVSKETSPYVRIFICFLMGISTFFLKSEWMPLLEKLPPIPQMLRQFLMIGFFFIAAKLYYGIFLVLLIVISFYPTTKGLKINVMKFGDISYGMFLIHYPLITGFYALLPNAPSGTIASMTILGLSIILSILMYKFVEARFLLPSSHYKKVS